MSCWLQALDCKHFIRTGPRQEVGKSAELCNVLQLTKGHANNGRGSGTHCLLDHVGLQGMLTWLQIGLLDKSMGTYPWELLDTKIV